MGGLWRNIRSRRRWNRPGGLTRRALKPFTGEPPASRRPHGAASSMQRQRSGWWSWRPLSKQATPAVAWRAAGVCLLAVLRAAVLLAAAAFMPALVLDLAVPLAWALASAAARAAASGSAARAAALATIRIRRDLRRAALFR